MLRRRILGVTVCSGGVGVVVVGGGVVALGDRGPLVEEKMMRGVGRMRVVVIVIGVGIRGSRRGCYVDPLLLPLPHRSSEHRGRSIPSRGPS